MLLSLKVCRSGRFLSQFSHFINICERIDWLDIFLVCQNSRSVWVPDKRPVFSIIPQRLYLISSHFVHILNRVFELLLLSDRDFWSDAQSNYLSIRTLCFLHSSFFFSFCLKKKILQVLSFLQRLENWRVGEFWLRHVIFEPFMLKLFNKPLFNLFVFVLMNIQVSRFNDWV